MITDSIRTAVLAACCTAIGLTAAEYIVPLEKFEKQIRSIDRPQAEEDRSGKN